MKSSCLVPVFPKWCVGSSAAGKWFKGLNKETEPHGVCSQVLGSVWVSEAQRICLLLSVLLHQTPWVTLMSALLLRIKHRITNKTFKSHRNGIRIPGFLCMT